MLAIFFTVTTGLLFLALNRAARGLKRIPDKRFWYGRETAFAIFGELGGGGRARYRQLARTLDLAFPLSYSAMFACSMTGMLELSVGPHVAPLGLATALAGAVCDIGENMLLASAMAHYPCRRDARVAVASVLTSAKWILVAAHLTATAVWIVWGTWRFMS